MAKTKSFLAEQLSEADAEREEAAAVKRELAEARVQLHKAESGRERLREEVSEWEGELLLSGQNSINSFSSVGTGDIVRPSIRLSLSLIRPLTNDPRSLSSR